MIDRVNQLAIGQRVKVIDGGLREYGQLGVVVDTSTGDSWYVCLDTRATERTFFQAEELEIVQARRRMRRTARTHAA